MKKSAKKQQKKETTPKEPLPTLTETVSKIEEEKKEEVVKQEESNPVPTPSPVNPMMNIFSEENKKRFSKSVEAEKMIEEEVQKGFQKEEKKTKPVIDKHKDDDRTIFVGNLPVEIIQKPALLRKPFTAFGAIKSMRFRSVAVKSSKIDHFDKKLMKKVSVIQNNLDEGVKSMNAYIVFEDKESVEKALSLNNSVLLDRHITVDTLSKKQHRNKNEGNRTLFIGNLPFDTDEEELRSFFETHIKQQKSYNASDSTETVVESVRIIRSKDTRVGKGFAYVVLKSTEYTPLGILLNGRSFHNRELRVSRYLRSTEAIEKKKQKDAAKNGRKKLRKPMKKEKVEKKEKTEKKEEKEEKKEVVKVEEEKPEKPEKPEKQENSKKTKERKRKDKQEKVKKDIDLSFMGKRATLSMNAVNAKKRLMKKAKK